MTWSTKTEYYGHFAGNKPDGRGKKTIIDKSGKKTFYEGDWAKGEMI